MMARGIRSWGILGAIVALAAAGAACGTTPTSPSTYAPYSMTDLTIGTGIEAVNGKWVTVRYTGWFYVPTAAEQKGVEFDSSVGRTPLTFILGAGQVIAAWEEGLPGMRVGGSRRLIVPPSKAYGAVRSGMIPANATLLFDVELAAVEPQYQQSDLVVGTGNELLSGMTATVKYTGWLYDESKPDNKGTQFDTTEGKDDFQFVVGEGTVIEGWELGVIGMKEGGKRRLVIPSAQAYGGTTKENVPPFSTLVFDIELVSAKYAETTSALRRRLP